MKSKKSVVALFLLPGLLGLTLFYAAPLVGGLYYSLTDGSRLNRFVGFQNYLDVWNNSMFQLGLSNTIQLSVLCAPVNWGLSLLSALLLSGKVRGGAFIRSSMLMPYLMPSSAILMVWLIGFDYGGGINRMLAGLGMERVLWLDGAYLRAPILLMYFWKNVGFCAVMMTAAIQTVPVALYEYAQVEGAGFFRRHWSVTLPMIAPTAFLAFVFSWINAFKIFKEVYFIGGAYPNESVYTLQNYMNNMFANLNDQYVTAAAYSFAVLVILLFGGLFLWQRRVNADA